MTEDEILDRASMPPGNPSYPFGPYRFVDRQYFMVIYETDADAIRAWLPEPLEPDGSGTVVYEWIDMPDSSGFGSYRESGLVIPTLLEGRPVNYTAMMFLNDEPPITAGREIWGFPKRWGEPTLGVRADLTDPRAADDLVGEAEDRLGPLAVLVNNAGVQHVAPIGEFPDDKWELILALNLSAAFRAIRAVVPGMTARGHGRIVNLASAHGLVASPGKAAYVSAKHGLLGLTKTAALETAEHGVTVNAICPGYVWTPLVESQISDTAKARGMTEEEVRRDVLLAAQPTREFATTAQVGALAVFLCSDAADQITGAALPVDGGWTAQ